MASISYTPEPHEQAYYGGLFRLADVEGTGNIGGAQAVQFFSRSKLPVEVLKNIWTVADQPSTSSLNPPKFAVALRLIQLTQNGQKGQGPTLAAPPGVALRPVFFEGVSGVSVPMPGPPGPQQGPPPPAPQPPQRGMAPPAAGAGRGPPPSQMQQQMQPPQSPQRLAMPPPSPRMPPQQQPPPQQQYQYPQMNAPVTPSRALVGPDPYSMTPQERARYESLFPQYAKPDGYVYGQEAVALFSKSGVDNKALRDIWNLVDRSPVDNRLDKLEFAMAMHLIVCVSKKNLPMPEGNILPNSLRALKAASAPAPHQHQAPPSMNGGVAIANSAPGSPLHSPQQQPQLYQPQMQYQHQPQPPSPMQVQTVDETPMPGPPPVVKRGGLSISDAFEGMDLPSSDTQPLAPSYQHAAAESRALPSYVPEVPISPQPSYVHHSTTVPEVQPTPVSTPAAVASVPAPSSSSDYDLGDAHTELGKLREVLQKLQAENISLKAQLGSMPEDEREVQKELGATIAEIGKLSSQLSAQRQEVLAAKNRLLEASAELKAKKEKESVMADLIGEAKETKNAIDEATYSIQNARQISPHHGALDAKADEAMKRSDTFESALFGYEDSGPTPASTGSFDAASHAVPPPSSAGHGEPPNSGTAARSIPGPVSYEDSEPSTSHFKYGGPPMSSQPTPFSNEAPQSMPPQQHTSPRPTPTFDRPAAVAGHNRQTSGFESGFVMGGSAPPSSSAVPDQHELTSAARAHSSSGDYGYEDEESFQMVEDMKKRAERAVEAARDAEAAHRRLENEANELREDADKAEASARSLRAAAEEKKKGRFGNNKKKSMERDAERAAQDAVEIKKRFMAVQTQAHDAEALAAETRREANKLKDEAEKAELDMASAASLKEQQKPSNPTTSLVPVQSNNTNGYGAEYGAGYSNNRPPTDYGYGQMPAPDQAYGGYGYGLTSGNGGGDYATPYGSPPGSGAPTMTMLQPSSDTGFASGVMGGGGNSYIPSPADGY